MNLNEEFSQNNFLEWIDELLPDFERDIKKVDVPKSFTDVSKIESLGKSTIGVMIFTIQMGSDPTRRKVSIAKDSFNLLKNYSVQNAIIAYFCPNCGQWRLSLLTSTATWENGKIISKLSNLKRQSFVLGVGAKTKTPIKYLAGKVIDLTDLKKRFSIEVVNKDFYKEISTAFNSLQTVLQLPDKQSKSQINLEFSVRLIGRIIFCWFLREKRSESGISLISDEVLSLNAVRNTKDYYHKLLEPLFFEVLNKPLESRNFDEFDKEPFTQIPYLNGGLFSAQYDDYYERGRNDFQSKYHNTLIIPNNWLESFFETLETYHFTIDENTSYDEELSIDPEMLGRIFENLLAEINPETGESARKSTGSYYTPRVIVEYMVDESLTLYLKNKTNIDEDKIRAIISYDLDDDQAKPLSQEEKEDIIDALGKLKILDPACGSGAFPMGALQKIVFILQQIDPNAEVMHNMDLKQTPPEFRRHIQEEFSAGNYDYLRKLRVIRECIYGVDIQPIATEISRLRCFLTLVVDQAIKDDKPDRGIKPLPNLDFKFVTANTLIGLPKNENGVQQMGIYDNREKIENLKEIIDDYFNSSGIEREQLKAKFAQEQKSLLREMEKEHGWSNMQKAELSNKLIDWEPFLHKAADWFDPEWMFGVKGGYDIVIANPPYITIRNQSSEIRDYIRSNYKYSGGADLYVAFIEKSKYLVNSEGSIVFICPNKFFGADYGKKIRNELRHGDLKIFSIWDLKDERVFEALISTIVIIIRSRNNSDQNVLVKNKNGASELDIFDERSKIQIEQSVDDKKITKKLDLLDTLSKFCTIRTGIMGFEYWKMEPIIHESGSGVQLLTNGNIDQFINRWGEKEINLFKRKFICPKIDLNTSYLNVNTINLFQEKNKIVVRGVAKKLTGIIDKDGSGLLVAVHSIIPTDKKYIYYFLGLINSNLLNWFHLHTFYSVRIPQGSLKYPIDCLKNLPTPDPEEHQKEAGEISQLVKKIIDDPSDLSAAKMEIDKCVYKLYNISEDEIKIIEESNQKLIYTKK